MQIYVYLCQRVYFFLIHLTMCEETQKAIKGEITNHCQKQRVNTEILNDLNPIEKGSQIAFFQLSVSHSYIVLTEKKTCEMLTKMYANFKIVSAISRI